MRTISYSLSVAVVSLSLAASVALSACSSDSSSDDSTPTPSAGAGGTSTSTGGSAGTSSGRAAAGGSTGGSGGAVAAGGKSGSGGSAGSGASGGSVGTGGAGGKAGQGGSGGAGAGAGGASAGAGGATAGTGGASAGTGGSGGTSSQTIVAIASADPALSTLVTAIGAADASIASALSNPGTFTVFAPTNEAFAKLPAACVTALTNPGNKPVLTGILAYHALAAEVHAADVPTAATEEDTLLDDPTTTGKKEQIGVQRTGAAVALTDSTTTAKNVTTADIQASNGVIHKIDGVLVPGLPAALLPTSCGGTGSDTGPQNIVDIVTADPDLSTLVTAVGAADAAVATALTGAGPLTLFAPTNTAFAALPSGCIAFLTDPANKATLTSILEYHVLASETHAAEVPATATPVDTLLSGAQVTVQSSSSGVTLLDILGATHKVVQADILATNGIVHKIDGVLIPLTAANVPAACK